MVLVYVRATVLIPTGALREEFANFFGIRGFLIFGLKLIFCIRLVQGLNIFIFEQLIG